MIFTLPLIIALVMMKVTKDLMQSAKLKFNEEKADNYKKLIAKTKRSWDDTDFIAMELQEQLQKAESDITEFRSQEKKNAKLKTANYASSIAEHREGHVAAVKPWTPMVMQQFDEMRRAYWKQK